MAASAICTALLLGPDAPHQRAGTAGDRVLREVAVVLLGAAEHGGEPVDATVEPPHLPDVGAAQIRTAWRTTVSNTGWSSNAELPIAPSTSLVAACCSVRLGQIPLELLDPAACRVFGQGTRIILARGCVTQADAGTQPRARRGR